MEMFIFIFHKRTISKPAGGRSVLFLVLRKNFFMRIDRKDGKGMEESYEVREGVLIVGLGHELDDHCATRIRLKTDEWILEGGIQGILFDFSETVFMDSSGIGMIIGRYKKMKARGGFVGVAGVGRNINRIMEISGLYKIIEVFEIQK